MTAGLRLPQDCFGDAAAGEVSRGARRRSCFTPCPPLIFVKRVSRAKIFSAVSPAAASTCAREFSDRIASPFFPIDSAAAHYYLRTNFMLRGRRRAAGIVRGWLNQSLSRDRRIPSVGTFSEI
jgi:hypothetical protein